MKGLVYPTAFGARDDVCNNRWEPPSELGGLYNILVKDNCRGVLQALRFRFQGQFLSLGPLKDSFVVGEDVVLMELLLDQEGFVYCGI